MNIFFVGIKGVGMAGLAVIAKQRGHNVSGCDINQRFITDPILAEAGISVLSGLKQNIPPKTNMVVFTGAHRGADNPTVIKASEQGIKTLSYARALAVLTQGKKIIAVAGTHGKTTTSAMLALILKRANTHPSWLIGTGQVKQLNAPANWDERGEYFVLEADEYPADFPRDIRAKFLYLSPAHLIITSIDWDHPDAYKTPEQFAKPFKKLLKKVPSTGYIILPTGFARLHQFSKGARGKLRWLKPGRYFPGLKLSLPGKHYLIDASLSAKMAHELGISKTDIISALNQFKGTNRRFEIIGKWENRIIIDDYAHHPTEIDATVEALKSRYPQIPLAVIFESHTFIRTKTYAQAFAKSLSRVDYLALAPIFASARGQKRDFSDDDFLSIVKQQKPDVILLKSPQQAKDWLAKTLPNNAIIVTMGAGKVWQWGHFIAGKLKEKQLE